MNKQIGSSLIDDMDRLDKEIRHVYKEVVLPTWNQRNGLHGLSNALYGYVTGVFARIDLFSAYWRGTYQDQSTRMVDFMVQYMAYDRDICLVALQIWRHKLMHTSRPRILQHPKKNVSFQYLIQWWDHLPQEQHFTFTESDTRLILNLGLMYLVHDLRSGLEKYLQELRSSADLQANYNSVEKELANYKLRSF